MISCGRKFADWVFIIPAFARASMKPQAPEPTIFLFTSANTSHIHVVGVIPLIFPAIIADSLRVIDPVRLYSDSCNCFCIIPFSASVSASGRYPVVPYKFGFRETYTQP